jgi:hypothetical protein
MVDLDHHIFRDAQQMDRANVLDIVVHRYHRFPVHPNSVVTRPVEAVWIPLVQWSFFTFPKISPLRPWPARPHCDCHGFLNRLVW